MGVSETIVAAMIGAIATVTTALFQLFGMFRARGKVDARPRRGLTMRSILAVLALMVASAAGGFLYSELLKQRHDEDIRAMRLELKELKQLAALAARAQEALVPSAAATVAADPVPQAPAVHAVQAQSQDSTAESVVYVPACRAELPVAQCEEARAQRIALCGTIPSFAQVRSIDLFVQPDAVQDPWEDHRVAFEQDLGGAKFTGSSFEYAQSGDLKAVCVNFMQWSSEHPHIARLLIRYGFGPVLPAQPSDRSFEALEPQDTQAPAVIAADQTQVH